MSASEADLNEGQRRLNEWRDRLLAARKNYEMAVTEAKAVGRDFTSGVLPPPDGGASVVSALKAETKARTEYMRVLRVFTDIVLSGKLPEE